MMEPKLIPWIGGEHLFFLWLGELRALQAATNSGPEELLFKIQSGAWRLDDLQHVIRLGLVGGGMDGAEASRLVTNLFDQHPLLTFKPTAIDVMLHVLSGPEGTDPGKTTWATAGPAQPNGTGTGSTAQG